MTAIAPEAGDFSVPSDPPSMNTVSREETAAVFSDAELSVLHPGMAAYLTPEQARDALSAQYSRVMGGKDALRPSRDSVRDRIVWPFLGALPDIVERHGGEGETIKTFLAELTTCMVGLRLSGLNCLDIGASYDDPDPERDVPAYERRIFPVLNLDSRLGTSFVARLDAVAALGGVWSVLGNKDQIEQWNAADPVALLNWLAEFRQYSSSVSFRIKIEGQQLKMLQAFFRAS